MAVVAAATLAGGGYCVYNGMQKGEEKKTEEKTENKTEDNTTEKKVTVSKANLKEKKVEELSTIEFYPDREVMKKILEQDEVDFGLVMQIADVPVNDKLPEKFIEEVKEIYNACGFDSGAYNEVYFVIKDETKESPAEQFRMIATKDMYEGKMIIRDYVSGPKFSDYWTEVYTEMETDQFFVERDW